MASAKGNNLKNRIAYGHNAPTMGITGRQDTTHSASMRFARACNNPNRGSRYASTTMRRVEALEADLVIAVEKSNEKGLTYAVRRLALQAVRDLQAQLDVARKAHSEALQRA